MLFAMFVFAMMGTAVKIVSQTVSTVEIVFFRNLFGILFIAASAFKTPIRSKGGKPLLLIFRGFAGSAALFAVFYNIANIPFSVAVSYIQTSPLFIALFAYLFLHEKLQPLSWIALILGLAGVLCITQPFEAGSGFEKTDLLGLLCGVGAAAAYTSIRGLREHYDTRTVILSFMVTGTLLPAVFMVFGGYFSTTAFDFLIAPFVWPNPTEWFWIFVVGATATLGQVYITKAYMQSKAGVIGAIGYTNIIFASIIGWFLGDKIPDSLTVMGIGLIILSGVAISREGKSG